MSPPKVVVESIEAVRQREQYELFGDDSNELMEMENSKAGTVNVGLNHSSSNYSIPTIEPPRQQQNSGSLIKHDAISSGDTAGISKQPEKMAAHVSDTAPAELVMSTSKCKLNVFLL